MRWLRALARVPGRLRAKHLGFVLIVLLGVGAFTAVRVADPFLMRAVRQVSFDLLQRLSPRTYVESPVRVVDIDERSLEALGQWPWPRDRLAELVDRLHAAGAAAVAFDFLFIEPDRMSPRRVIKDLQRRNVVDLEDAAAMAELPDTDALFADAIRRGNVVLGFGTSAEVEGLPPVKAGFAYTGADPAAVVTRFRGGARLLPELAEAAAGIGSVTLNDQLSAGAIRTTALIWSEGSTLYPSLAAEALRIAQGAQTYVVHADKDGLVQSIRIGGFEIPTGPSGALNLHYTPPRAERYISAVDIFDNQRLRALAPELSGGIVLIGTSATGLFDLHTTALGDTVPGVEMHAQALEQMISGQFLRRHDWTRGVELLALAFGALLVAAVTIYGSARLALLLGAVTAALIAFVALQAFRNMGVLVDFSFPLGGGLAVWFGALAFRYIVSDKEKREIRGAFSHYVHPSVLKQIERNASQVRLGGENCELTVLFTDVRNFTPLSERLTPEQVVGFLNALLSRIGAAVTREGGVIDKFIGDAVMAFWNAPLRQSDHAHRACAAALGMRGAMREMNATRGFGLPDEVAAEQNIEIGVGINTGPACVGNVGSSDRFNYSAIGDAVNVAARVETASKELAYDLLVSVATAEQAPEFAYLDGGSVQLKGKAAAVSLKVLVGDAELGASAAFRAFAERYDTLLGALRAGDEARVEAEMARCRSMAPAVEPGLVRYLDRLWERREDFRGHSQAAEPARVPAE